MCVAYRRFIFSVFCCHWKRYGRKVRFSYCSSSCFVLCFLAILRQKAPRAGRVLYRYCKQHKMTTSWSKCKYIFSTVQQSQSKKPEIPRLYSEFGSLVELLKRVVEGKHPYQHSTKEAKRCPDEMYLTPSFCRKRTFTRYKIYGNNPASPKKIGVVEKMRKGEDESCSSHTAWWSCAGVLPWRRQGFFLFHQGCHWKECRRKTMHGYRPTTIRFLIWSN